MSENLPKITVYNSLTQKKEDMQVHEGNKVRMYACGPTVYDSAHLGHARSAVSFDIIQRFLRYAGYDVTFVRNYTDIDDKIINRANELGVSSACKRLLLENNLLAALQSEVEGKEGSCMRREEQTAESARNAVCVTMRPQAILKSWPPSALSIAAQENCLFGSLRR